MTNQPQVVVIGSGVIGLTSALVLAERGFAVHILARDLPEDTHSQQFASPWAGANHNPFDDDPLSVRWETATFKKLWSLIPRGVAMELPALSYVGDEKELEKHWFKDLYADYRRLRDDELPQGKKAGVSFTTLSVNAPIYIQWLASQLRLLGVVIERRTVQSIEEAFASGNTVVVNATGLGAKSIIGVEDLAVEPIRGQTILVKAPHVKTCIMHLESKGGKKEASYIIPRPGGEVIMGGCFQVGNWDLSVDYNLAEDIRQRCIALEPALKDAPILRHNVGLRPSRRGGPRLEAEKIALPLSSSLKPAQPPLPRKEGVVVHAYGIGPAGFQASWGMAHDVAELVEAAVRPRQAHL